MIVLRLIVSLILQFWEIASALVCSKRLFAISVRIRGSRPGRNEPRFKYLSRSNRYEASRIRRLCNRWFSQYPATGQSDVHGRFKSTDDVQHYSAFFELFCYQLLNKCGYTAEVHPILPDENPNHPDFLVRDHVDAERYFEATICTDATPESESRRKIVNAVLDSVDQISLPGMRLGVEPRGDPKSPLPARKIRDEVIRNLKSLDPGQLEALAEEGGIRFLPHFLFSRDGWEFEYFPIPVHVDSPRGPFIGAHSSSTEQITVVTALRNCILRKAAKYGELTRPYILAVNVFADLGLDKEEIMAALFGTLQVHFPVSSSHRESGWSRAADGVWIDEQGPRYRRLSAVLFINNALPWQICEADICLVHNPWATYPCRDFLPSVANVIFEDDQTVWPDGPTAGAVLNLPAGWPRLRWIQQLERGR